MTLSYCFNKFSSSLLQVAKQQHNIKLRDGSFQNPSPQNLRQTIAQTSDVLSAYYIYSITQVQSVERSPFVGQQMPSSSSNST